MHECECANVRRVALTAPPLENYLLVRADTKTDHTEQQQIIREARAFKRLDEKPAENVRDLPA
jgi:hypothetical protein